MKVKGNGFRVSITIEKGDDIRIGDQFISDCKALVRRDLIDSIKYPNRFIDWSKTSIEEIKIWEINGTMPAIDFTKPINDVIETSFNEVKMVMLRDTSLSYDSPDGKKLHVYDKAGELICVDSKFKDLIGLGTGCQIEGDSESCVFVTRSSEKNNSIITEVIAGVMPCKSDLNNKITLKEQDVA